MYTVLGAAQDRDRTNQFVRVLGLSRPLQELSSDTLITAYNPATGASWDVAGIKNDPEWLARGNADENGETNGYTFEKLREGEPLSEDNFILTDVPANDFEQVARWLRSRLPTNDGGGRDTTWALRSGALATYSKPGTLPDSNADADGNFSTYNAMWWLRFDVSAPWAEEWYRIYLNAEPPEQSYIENQFATNSKVGRTGASTPFYEYPAGAPVLALVDPEYYEAGSVQWVRLQR